VSDINIPGRNIDHSREKSELNEEDKCYHDFVMKHLLSSYRLSQMQKDENNYRLSILNQPKSQLDSRMEKFAVSQHAWDRERSAPHKSHRTPDQPKSIMDEDLPSPDFGCNKYDASQEPEETFDFGDIQMDEPAYVKLNATLGLGMFMKQSPNYITGKRNELFNQRVEIPHQGVGKLIYGVAIPGKILGRKESPYLSTSTLLIATAKAKLDVLGIRTTRYEKIRTLILEDAEEVYREARYGNLTWLGIVQERKQRYDPETREWKFFLRPSQWRQHGRVLPEGQDVRLSLWRLS
jgi:hypothetical protein